MPLLDAPLRCQRMYSRQKVPIRENVPQGGSLPYDKLWFHTYLWEHLYVGCRREPITDVLPEGFDLRDLTALYYGAVSWVDAIVGELMAALARAGALEDTIIIFASDHGDNLGSHQVWNKGRFWEESVRVPLLFHAPGRLAPRWKLAKQVHVTDRGGHAWLASPDDATDLFLFDLARDPYEMKNLAAAPEWAAVRDDLGARLDAWHRETPWLELPPGVPGRWRKSPAQAPRSEGAG